MKIITIVRTLNEMTNIQRFLTEYGKISDLILIADGGSTDGTRVMASAFEGCIVKLFDERATNEENGLWRNPEGEHINFLIEWAESLEPDWILFDDCDSVPTSELKKHTRSALRLCEEEKKWVLMAPRMYVYGADKWFPNLSKPGPSIWGWHRKYKMRYHEFDPWSMEAPGVKALHQFQFGFPDALLHFFCPNEEYIQKKLKFYRESGQSPTMLHPLEFGGPLEGLPNWAVL